MMQNQSDVTPHTEFDLTELLPATDTTKTNHTTNVLIDAADRLLRLIPCLQHISPPTTILPLRKTLNIEVQHFESQAKTTGIPAQTVSIARYIICTVLDEIILNTSWGETLGWSLQPLLSAFHEDSWGGEKFFSYLENLQKDPTTNKDILELMYICLSLGFSGKYRLAENGQEELAVIRQKLFRHIQAYHETGHTPLSPPWQKLAWKSVEQFIPIWQIPLIIALVLIGTYLLFGNFLDSAAQQPVHDLQTIQQIPSVTPSVVRDSI
jgi:type VI secretion system protein ImpK